MTTPARPTLRCLRDDLRADWDEVGDQRDVEQGLAGRRSPVHALRHKLIQKAVGDFPATAAPGLLRESISGLTNPPWWKVKTDRWRGAVYVDPVNGQAWLVAGGLRYGGEGKDFYARFMETVGTRGPEYYLPTAADLELLRHELVLDELERWEAQLVAMAKDGIHRGFETGDMVELVIPGPSGQPLCELNIAYTPADADAPHELLIELVPLDWSSTALMEWAELVVMAAIHRAEDRWGSTYGSTRLHSLELDDDEVPQMLAGETSAEHAGCMEAGALAHSVHTSRLMELTLAGMPVRAVCGMWFVPRQDHESKPHCERCRMLVQVFASR